MAEQHEIETGGLELSQDLDFQRRDWRFQHIGWVILGALVIAAILGVFGAGLLADATAGHKGDTLYVEYSRFGRQQSPLKLTIHLGAEATSGHLASVRISRDYLEAVRIHSLTPEPEWMEAAPAFVRYVFRTSAATGPTIVTLAYEASGPGLLEATLALDTGGEASFRQLIFP